MKHAIMLSAIAFGLMTHQTAFAITVAMQNCNWTQGTELWNAGCGPVNTCIRIDGTATVTNTGTLNDHTGVEFCCRQCYKPPANGKKQVCCAGAGAKTCTHNLKVATSRNFSFNLANEFKVGGEIYKIKLEDTIKTAWNWGSSNTGEISVSATWTAQECKYQCQVASLSVYEGREVSIVSQYKVQRQSAHYGQDGSVCSCWSPPCYVTCQTATSTGTGNFSTGAASADLSDNGSCADPAGTCACAAVTP